MRGFQPYRRDLAGGLVLCSTREEHAEQLGRLQEIVFPTLSPSERFRPEHYRHHVALFPEGQFVALDGDRVVGMTTTIRLDFDFQCRHHQFADVFQGGWLSSHQPAGRWLYGADIGTHPDHRRRGIARELYRARHELVRALGLEGQVTVGMMNGYGAVAHRMSPRAYYEGLCRGSIVDPTLSAQMAMGFEARGLVEDYLSDPACGGCGVLIVLEAGRDVR